MDQSECKTACDQFNLEESTLFEDGKACFIRADGKCAQDAKENLGANAALICKNLG